MSQPSTSEETFKLTQYSHGAGCGCKISPSILEKILQKSSTTTLDPRLLVGNLSNDDAAVYDLGNGTAVVSTTDFFMPIVDDAFQFGGIASVNAISDIYAMGGKPIMAIAILGWPITKLPPELAGTVLEGSRDACRRAGIELAGGHSIDSPEPIFGLAVTGLVEINNLKRNNTARPESSLYLTKKLGVGVVTTAQKRGIADESHLNEAKQSMLTLNDFGAVVGSLSYVNALTDVTGFGLLGHLNEFCDGANLEAEIHFASVPHFDWVNHYIEAGCIPGGTDRNWASYGHKVGELTTHQRNLLADPQTSGGLLVSVEAGHESEFESVAATHALHLQPIGKLLNRSDRGKNIYIR
jgi:selenide, water dikinase